MKYETDPKRTLAFARAFKAQFEADLREYGNETSVTAVASLIRQAGLSEDQRTLVITALRQALTDSYYGVLLGLEGSASIGGVQQMYTILDEDGAVVSGSDTELGGYADHYFQSDARVLGTAPLLRTLSPGAPKPD